MSRDEEYIRESLLSFEWKYSLNDSGRIFPPRNEIHMKNQFEWLSVVTLFCFKKLGNRIYLANVLLCLFVYNWSMNYVCYAILSWVLIDREFLLSSLRSLSLSYFILHLLFSLSLNSPCSLCLSASPNSRQESTIGCSSSHLINNPPTMSTPSGSHLINDLRRASQCR